MLELWEIKKYLENTLRPLVADPGKLRAWLDELFALTTAGGSTSPPTSPSPGADEEVAQALGVSIYIDLVKGSVDADLIAQTIDGMDFRSPEARDSFAAHPEDEDEQPNYLCKHEDGPQTLRDDDQYIRVMKLKDMIEYYLRDALTLSTPCSYEAEKEVLDRFVLPPAASRRGLGVVTGVFRGGRMNVWVASKKDLDTARSVTGSDDEAATLIRDRFGLYDLNRGTLVYVLYPSGFRGVDFYVPTTLDIGPFCQFYVSNDRSSGWGLTCGLTAAKEGINERVHVAFDGLTDAFTIEMIGAVDVDATPDTDHLLKEALRRAN